MTPPPPTSTLFPYTTLFRSTVLFTDIVGSSERATELGDRRWRELLEAHHAAIRREFEQLAPARSEEHTSELQSRGHLVCRLLLEKKKKKKVHHRQHYTNTGP